MAEGFVYVIMASSGHVKIGKTTNLKVRLSALQTACPFPLNVINKVRCDDALLIESVLHKQFASKRVSGEWFMPDQKDLEYLIGLNEDSLFGGSEFALEDEAVCSADAAEAWIDSITPMWGEL